MSRWLDLKIFLLLIVSTTFIIGFSSLGTFAYETAFSGSKGYAEGTKIGTISLQGLSAEQAQTKILQAVEEWKANSTFKLKYQEDELVLDPSFLQFDINGSVEALKDGQTTPLLVRIDKANLKEQVKNYNELLATVVDFDSLMDNIKTKVMSLNQGSLEFYISEFLVSSSQDQNQELSKSVTTGFEKELEPLIGDWIKSIGPINLKSTEYFSLLSVIEGDHISEQRLQALNVIASGLYESVLKAGLAIDERHISDKLPTYSKLGFEAKVKPDTMDLVFTNESISDISIRLELANSSLIVKVEGQSQGISNEIVLKNEKTLSQKQLVKPNAALKMGGSRIVSEGKEGKIVQVYREKVDKTGKVVESKLISEDYYAPIPSVLEVPLKPDSETMEQIKENLVELATIQEELKSKQANETTENTMDEDDQ